MSSVRAECRVPYVQIGQTHERVGLDGIGCIIGIVNSQGMLYVVEETNPEKGIGAVNLITEKRRFGESIQDNVQGALVEEVGVTQADLPHFWYVPGRISYVGSTWFPHHDLRVRADVVLLYYAGERKVFGSRNEVRGSGFVRPEALLNLSTIRRATIPALALIHESGNIEKLLTAAKVGIKKPVFSERFNPEAFFHERALKPDLFV